MAEGGDVIRTKRVMMRMTGRTERTTSQYCHVPHTVLSLNESEATMPANERKCDALILSGP